MSEVPRRIAVQSPRTTAARRARPVVRDPGDDHVGDHVGELLVRSLIRAQLGLGLRLAAVFLSLLGGLPLLFAVLPATRAAEVFGLPLPWLLLGVLVYPVLALGGWLYVRLAERHERDFAELVEHS